MMNEESIKILKDIKNHYQLQAGGFQYALNRGIEALKRESVIENIKVEIENKRKFYSQEIDDGDASIAFGLELALDIIDEHLNQEGEE